MAEKKIGEIVQKVYKKANESCVSDAKNALAIHVEDEIFNQYKKKISYRTVERAFERHIFNDTSVSERNSESICLLCKYLGFDDYKDYVNKNPRIIGIGNGKKSRRWGLIVISIALGVILITALMFKNQIFTDTNKPLIWYYKNSNGEIEYFTAPSLHPINGEMLHKITPLTIQNYRPIHIDRKDSHLP